MSRPGSCALLLVALWAVFQTGCTALTGAASPSAPSGPVITAQPANQSVVAGQPATFNVTATGSGQLSYQWKKNGTAISGATSPSYTTSATATSDSGSQFTVAVTAGSNTISSNAATLTVSQATHILNASLANLNFSNVTLGTTSTLSVTLTNAGNSPVTVSNVGISGPGFSAGGISTGEILAPGQSAILSVTFAPASAGSVTGSVSILSNATPSTDTVALAGTGVTAGAHSVALSWNPDTSSVSGYNVYRSTISGGPYSVMNSAEVTSTQYLDSSVQGGSTYYYAVTAVSSTGVESARSAEVSAIVP